ncbi:hypothetical protein JW826_06240 [Candidatus Woesearchaeota archaeon]|nr:hypothetical protein [Candidatus Woesearchaeota archaeon]
MNSYNHFITSFIILVVLFFNKVSIVEIVLFALVFGVLIDGNQTIGKRMRKPEAHKRTWIEEPFGVLFLGVPLGLLLSSIKKEYYLLTVIPYAVHVAQDYLTIHEVSPLAPFSRKNMKTGFFKSSPAASWYTGNEKGVSEKYFLALNILALVAVVGIYFI